MLPRIDNASLPILAEELLKVRHPSAIYYALYSSRLNVQIPDSLCLSSMVDPYLSSEISRVLGAPRSNWATFEHWWRKARVETTWSEEAKAFVLQSKNINLN
jgi:hypothetical protein